MSSYTIQDMQIDENRKKGLRLQSQLEVLYGKCEIEMRQLQALEEQLKQLGVTNVNNDYIKDVLTLQKKIREVILKVSSLNTLKTTNFAQQYSLCEKEAMNLMTNTSDMLSAINCKAEKQVSNARTKVIEGASGLDFSIKARTDVPVEQKENTKVVLSTELCHEIESILSNEALPESFRDGINEIYLLAQSQTTKVNMDIVTKQLSKSITIAQSFIQTLTEYQAQCLAFDIKPIRFECNSQGIEQMKLCIKNNNEQYYKEKERQYIRQTFDSVMSELGYRVDGTHGSINTTIYQIPDSEGVFVERTIDGTQVTIDFAINENADNNKILECMNKWCCRNRILGERLAEYGISLNMRTFLPPDKDIVNRMRSEVNIKLETSRNHRPEKTNPIKKQIREHTIKKNNTTSSNNN